jgi:hypothetical protein
MFLNNAPAPEEVHTRHPSAAASSSWGFGLKMRTVPGLGKGMQAVGRWESGALLLTRVGRVVVARMSSPAASVASFSAKLKYQAVPSSSTKRRPRLDVSAL